MMRRLGVGGLDACFRLKRDGVTDFVNFLGRLCPNNDVHECKTEKDSEVWHGHQRAD